MLDLIFLILLSFLVTEIAFRVYFLGQPHRTRPLKVRHPYRVKQATLERLLDSDSEVRVELKHALEKRYQFGVRARELTVQLIFATLSAIEPALEYLKVF